jgi:hypothetical protein
MPAALAPLLLAVVALAEVLPAWAAESVDRAARSCARAWESVILAALESRLASNVPFWTCWPSLT